MQTTGTSGCPPDSHRTKERGYYSSDSLSDDLKNKIDSCKQPTTIKYATAEARKGKNMANQHQQTPHAPRHNPQKSSQTDARDKHPAT